MRISLAMVLVAGWAAFPGCAGDETDVGNGAVCTGMLYDNCASEHDCMSNDCHTFAIEGFNVCTQTCSATVPCPDLDGAAVACDTATGVCKPTASRVCRVLP